MKFGHNLPRNVVPEWGSSYIRYKNLKKLIKSVSLATKLGHEIDLAGKIFTPLFISVKGAWMKTNMEIG